MPGIVKAPDGHELYAGAERPAATLMELLVPVDWSEIARRSDIAELRREIAGLYHRLVVTCVMLMLGLTGLVFTVAKAA